MPKKTTWAPEAVNTLFLLFFAIFIAIESYRLGLGEWRNPGPGFFAFGGAAILGLTSLSAFLREVRKMFRKNISDLASAPEPVQWSKVVLFVIAAMMVYAAIFEKIGFVPTSFLLIAFLLRVVGRQRWVVTILTALFCSFAAYVLFHMLLGCDLPRGILGF
jgi:putative tricarboxylic transport membrane protein